VFEIIPAIDLKDGRPVRLFQGDFDQATVYGDDPLAMAARWESAGATRLHVVDLDGAKAGGPRQHDIAARIAATAKVPVQLGGGFRSIDHVSAAIDAGIDRVILGTAALEDPELLDRALALHGERIAVGIDARDGMVAVRGWLDTASVGALDFARDLERRGVRTIIYTDISRDGTLVGANVEATRAMSQAVPGVSVIASGGIGSVDDIAALLDTGATGVIVGKALYGGAVRLEDARALVGGQAEVSAC
jgi:phosphoribosylformimino-5-aminoimidazole carboxamide ribotide isomerase